MTAWGHALAVQRGDAFDFGARCPVMAQTCGHSYCVVLLRLQSCCCAASRGGGDPEQPQCPLNTSNMVQGTSPGAPMGTMPRRELPPCPGPITTCVTSRRQSPLHARNTHGGPRYPISRSTKSLTVPPLEGVGDGGEAPQLLIPRLTAPCSWMQTAITMAFTQKDQRRTFEIESLLAPNSHWLTPR